MKYCPSCRTHLGIASTDIYCWLCGTRLTTSSGDTCACGCVLSRSDVYCTHCGKKVTREPVPTPSENKVQNSLDNAAIRE